MTREEAEKAIRAKRAAYKREWRKNPANKAKEKEYRKHEYERKIQKLMEGN